jgi:hypothetical protein
MKNKQVLEIIKKFSPGKKNYEEKKEKNLVSILCMLISHIKLYYQ